MLVRVVCHQVAEATLLTIGIRGAIVFYALVFCGQLVSLLTFCAHRSLLGYIGCIALEAVLVLVRALLAGVSFFVARNAETQYTAHQKGAGNSGLVVCCSEGGRGIFHRYV